MCLSVNASVQLLPREDDCLSVDGHPAFLNKVPHIKSYVSASENEKCVDFNERGGTVV